MVMAGLLYYEADFRVRADLLAGGALRDLLAAAALRDVAESSFVVLASASGRPRTGTIRKMTSDVYNGAKPV
jgi:hypothetical protein